MQKTTLILMAGAMLVMSACGKQSVEQSEADENKSPTAPATGPPVETQKANTAYRPDQGGQCKLHHGL